MSKQELGIYIHIPFCKKKCYYCDFMSFCNKDKYIDKYIDALIKEIESKKEEINNKEITTVYIGGGTPSYINPKYISKIIEKLNINKDIEITIEVNPGTVYEEKLKEYRKAGINRLSIGLQETNNELLKKIGRIHTYEEFLTTYELARKIGFNNINVDLIIGLPGQSISDIKESLNKIISLNPEHVSVYSLILEENTVLYNKVEKNEEILPDEELERNMYWYVKNTLELNGYNHYEISNFAKKGYESNHNYNCWEQKEYLGFGLAAHSYFDLKRFSNINNIEEYISNIENNNINKNIEIHEAQIKPDQEKEYMLLGLRKIDGVSITKFKNKFGENPIFLYKEQLDKLVKDELIIIESDYIKLTNKGIDLANLVWEEFI